jgi:DnaD/phage-associated family protein
MSWAKIDDQFYLNPKNAKIDRDEQDLYLAGLVYCNGQLTDGFIPAGVVALLAVWSKLPIEANAQAIASLLVEHKYWDVVEGGYNVHDFLDWNMSKEEVLILKSARTEAGRAGGIKSAAKRQANARASAQAKSKQSSTQSPSPSPIKEEEEEPPQPKNIYTVYSNNIGNITQIIADALDQAEKDYTYDWIVKAIDEAVKNNVRSWAYIETILMRWKRDGFQADNRTPKPQKRGNGNGYKPTEAEQLEAARAALYGSK